MLIENIDEALVELSLRTGKSRETLYNELTYQDILDYSKYLNKQELETKQRFDRLELMLAQLTYIVYSMFGADKKVKVQDFLLTEPTDETKPKPTNYKQSKPPKYLDCVIKKRKKV